ncbi:MAG: hypothetical protein O7D32_03070, partial [bacterium]|nr:hypothetical protein [bacterium]
MRLVIPPFLVLAGLITSGFDPAAARTWYVEPDGTGDVINIQVAIADSASPGDTVLLAPGEFRGPGNTDVDFGGMAVTVTSALGAGFTKINCESRQAFLFQSGEGPSTVLSEVTIINGFDSF